MKNTSSGKTPERVKELLKKAVEEKSQSAVARESGIALYSVQRYLKGIGVPTEATFKKLSEYFDVPVDYLTENSIMEMILAAAMPAVSQKYPEASQIEQHKLILNTLPEMMGKVFKELMADKAFKGLIANTEINEEKSTR